MKVFDRIRNRKEKNEGAPVLQTAERSIYRPFGGFCSYSPAGGEYELYKSLRDTVPVIDAALDKIVRLMGSFNVVCTDKGVENRLGQFLRSVRSGGQPCGIYGFLSVYMSQLLTYGTAVGEIVVTGSGRDIYSLVNVPLKNIELRFDENLIDVLVCPSGACAEPFEYQELLCVSQLNPEPGKPGGVSVLHGLPFVSDILMKIYTSIGINWERVGNVRFAVTYKPSGDSDRAMSKARACQIADEWSKAMRNEQSVSDFVSVGDVSIKVIGADNQVLDSEVPVRQMLEQIVAKLSVPPFLLGLSWSTTERMSSQQADILTSELEHYRRILSGVIERIVGVWLRLHGYETDFEVIWDNINLQDELDLARAQLYRAQAEKLAK